MLRQLGVQIQTVVNERLEYTSVRKVHAIHFPDGFLTRLAGSDPRIALRPCVSRFSRHRSLVPIRSDFR